MKLRYVEIKVKKEMDNRNRRLRLEAKTAKMKYHETWMRHTKHYILLNRECRNFAEMLGEYEKLSDEEALKLFIKNIYEIEDDDITQCH